MRFYGSHYTKLFKSTSCLNSHEHNIQHRRVSVGIYVCLHTFFKRHPRLRRCLVTLFFFFFSPCLNCILSAHCRLPLCQWAGVWLWSGLIPCPRGLVGELGDGERCIIHKCVAPCAWVAVTRSCQRIPERDSSGCGEDTPQGLLACAGLWVGPRDGGTGFREDRRVIWMQKTTEKDAKKN